MDFINKAPWEDELHESNKILDRICRDMNIYDAEDSCFPDTYNLEALKVIALTQIVYYLKIIAEGSEPHE